MTRLSAIPNSGIYSLGELAQRIGAEVSGDASCEITGLATLQEAQLDQLSFLANPVYVKYLASSQAGAVIMHPDMADQYSGNKLLLNNPYLGYAQLTAVFDAQPIVTIGIHPSAVVDKSANVDPTAAIAANAVVEAGAAIGAGTQIGAGTYIGADSVIGEKTRINANVSIYHGVSIGSNVIIHSGAVIGGDGFGFAPTAEGWSKIYQLGGVIVGDNVEVGANTTIDRGALGDTIVSDGVKIDNLVQIAHNVQLGRNTAIASCAAIAGSAVIGENCTIAGCAGIVGHITIADNVHVTGMTLVSKSIKESGSYSSGTPMDSSKHWRKNAVRFGQLDDLARRVKQLEKRS